MYSLLYMDTAQYSTIGNISPLLFCKWTSFSARNEELLWLLEPNCYTTLLRAHSSLCQRQTWDGQQRSTSTRHGVCNLPAFPENSQLRITSSWHQSKPCIILSKTTNLPLTVRMSPAVQSEAVPLWYTGFSYTQVTHLICYLLKPPNLAVEGDCTIAKTIGEN